MKVFGRLDASLAKELAGILEEASDLHVVRRGDARSANPQPMSIDLEHALRPLLGRHGFEHHQSFTHPKADFGFEFDFWRDGDGVALEIMGYRADDEVYKNLLKFHVHPSTRIGVVFVPRWKWISGKKHDRNYKETQKALSFADSYMALDSLVSVAYFWAPTDGYGEWKLRFQQK